MEKKKINLSTILLIISLIIIIIMGFFIYKLYNDKQSADNQLKILNDKVAELQNKVDNFKNDNQQKETNDDIIKYELQTHEYFSDVPDVYNYFIDSESELNVFYNIYSDNLNINKNYLKNNSIFIQVSQASSGSTMMKLSSVTFDNNTVNFIVDKSSPKIGTDDMAFWYLVAIIPKEQLNNLNLSDWNKPSEILLSPEDYRDELSKENKEVLIVKSYSRKDWEMYNGWAIFNDGTIYSYSGNFNISSVDELKNDIFEINSKKLSSYKRVPAKDIEKIEEYINNIEDSIEIEDSETIQGTTIISAWNSNGKEIKLSVKGDSFGENKTSNAQELLKIVNKYL